MLKNPAENYMTTKAEMKADIKAVREPNPRYNKTIGCEYLFQNIVKQVRLQVVCHIMA